LPFLAGCPPSDFWRSSGPAARARSSPLSTPSEQHPALGVAGGESSARLFRGPAVGCPRKGNLPGAAAEPSSPTRAIMTTAIRCVRLNMVLLQEEGRKDHGDSGPWFCHPSLVSLLLRQDAAETDVRHAGVRTAAVPGAGAVARTVAIVAQERAAALHPPGREGARRVDAAGRPGRATLPHGVTPSPS